MLITYYTYLEIKEDASINEIRRSFRLLAFKYHPDHNSSPAAHDHFVKINKAYEVLSDPLRRQKYNSDLWLFRNQQQKIDPNTAPRYQYASTSASHAKPADYPQQNTSPGHTGGRPDGSIHNRNINNKTKTTQGEHKNFNQKKNGSTGGSASIFLLCCLGFVTCTSLVGVLFSGVGAREQPRTTIEVGGSSETYLSNLHPPKEQIHEDRQQVTGVIEESASNRVGRLANKPSLNETLTQLDRILQTERARTTTNTPPQESQYKNNRSQTGARPYRAFYGNGTFDAESLSRITFNNGGNDVIIMLIDVYCEIIIRHCYIRANDIYTMQQIPDGTYRFKAYSGRDWNPTKFMGEGVPRGGFDNNESFYTSRFKKDNFVMAPEYYTDCISYPTYEITLYGVNNGNMQTKNISKANFFNTQ